MAGFVRVSGYSQIEPELVGTYTGNQTVNVSAYIRPTDTVDNFIVEIYSHPLCYSGDIIGDRNTDHYGAISASSLSKTLSGNNLVVSGMTDTVSVHGKRGTSSNSRNFSWRLYHV
jgi:hypothetical protein